MVGRQSQRASLYVLDPRFGGGGRLTLHPYAVVTNSPEHDPDIQHLPFFAITTKFFSNLRSSYHKRVLAFDAFARTVLPHQFVPCAPSLLARPLTF